MARIVNVDIVCDIHQDAEDVMIEATELPPISVNNAKPRILAVCKECREPIEEFLAILKKLGVTPEGLGHASSTKAPLTPGVQSSGDVFCEFPGCERPGPMKNRGSLSSHMRGFHHMGLREYQKRLEAGTLSEHQPTLMEEDQSEFACDLPSVDDPSVPCDWMPKATSTRPSYSKFLHQRQAHGYTPPKEVNQ